MVVGGGHGLLLAGDAIAHMHMPACWGEEAKAQHNHGIMGYLQSSLPQHVVVYPQRVGQWRF